MNIRQFSNQEKIRYVIFENKNLYKGHIFCLFHDNVSVSQYASAIRNISIIIPAINLGYIQCDPDQDKQSIHSRYNIVHKPHLNRQASRYVYRLPTRQRKVERQSVYGNLQILRQKNKSSLIYQNKKMYRTLTQRRWRLLKGRQQQQVSVGKHTILSSTV